MNRRIPIHIVHAAAGLLALVIILAFWSSTVFVELFGDQAAVTTVKLAIAWCLLILVPSLAVTGASGFAMYGSSRTGLIGRKLRRMRIIAANGVVLLVPSALFLAWKANAGQFDAAFVAIQGVELAAGAVNATLMTLNIRDGLRLSGRFRAVRAATVRTLENPKLDALSQVSGLASERRGARPGAAAR